MDWLSAISTRRSFGLDVEAAVRGLEEQLGAREPDLVMVFLSHHHAAHLRTTAAFLLRRFERAVLVGVTGAGVIGAGREVEGEPAVSMVGAILPDVELRPFHVTPAEVQYLVTHPEHWHERLPIPSGVRPTFLLFPEPFTCDGEKLVRGLDAAWPDAIKLGGLASGARHPGQNKLLLDRAVHDRGAIGIAMWGNLEVDVIVAQGGAPVGHCHRITEVAGHLVTRLDDRPALSVLEDLVTALPNPERDVFVGAPVVGLRAQGTDGFVIRNVIGVDRRRGAVGVSGAPAVGDDLQFHIRDARTAREELQGLMAGAAPADGALLVSCIARGEGFFRAKDHDTQVIRNAQPELPVAGFFANGELGPIGGRTWLHGYTSVLALFRTPR